LNARYLPKAGLFLQGGYGRPALNMLSNAFEPYYITGLRLNWNITGYYTLKKEKKILDINRSSTDLQSETFLFNTKLSMSQQNREIRKYEELITSDNEIVGLRENIKNTSKEQLQYGTITANDYITYVNAEDQARQNLLLHQIQLLLAQYTYQNTTGF
jgi:outer membrane protein TolC